MDTIIEKVNNIKEDYECIEKAGQIIKEGGLVGFPTETVYGLGADALNEDAAAKLNKANSLCDN